MHIGRFCDREICGRCQEEGHLDRHCPLLNQVREVKIHFPFHQSVRAAVSATALREIPRVGANMQYLRELPVTRMNGSRYSSDGNVLMINYSGRERICVALQDSSTIAETLIQIGPDGNAGHKVRFSARFTIQNGQLTEDPDRVASGYQHQQSPSAHTHVLCFAREMLRTTCAITVDGRRFYIDWNEQNVEGRFRAEVNVFTLPRYNARLLARGRELVENRREYFQGAIMPRAEEVAENAQQPAIVEADAINAEIPLEEICDESPDEPADPADIQQIGNELAIQIIEAAENTMVREQNNCVVTGDPAMQGDPASGNEQETDSDDDLTPNYASTNE